MSKQSKGSLFFLYHIKESIEAIKSYLIGNTDAKEAKQDGSKSRVI